MLNDIYEMKYRVICYKLDEEKVEKMSRMIIGFLLGWMPYCMPLNRMDDSVREIVLEGAGKKLIFHFISNELLSMY